MQQECFGIRRWPGDLTLICTEKILYYNIDCEMGTNKSLTKTSKAFQP